MESIEDRGGNLVLPLFIRNVMHHLAVGCGRASPKGMDAMSSGWYDQADGNVFRVRVLRGLHSAFKTQPKKSIKDKSEPYF